MMHFTFKHDVTHWRRDFDLFIYEQESLFFFRDGRGEKVKVFQEIKATPFYVCLFFYIYLLGLFVVHLALGPF